MSQSCSFSRVFVWKCVWENASRLVTGGQGISWQRASGWIRQSRKLTAAHGPCCQGRASCVRGSSLPAPSSGSERKKKTFRPPWRLNNQTESTEWAVNTSDLVELFFSDVGFVLSAESSEGALYLLTGFDVLCLAADHECHILLQRYVAIPATTHSSLLGSKHNSIQNTTQPYCWHTPNKLIYETWQTCWDQQYLVWTQTQDLVRLLPPWAGRSPASVDMTWTLGGSDDQTSPCRNACR